jgi:hypothetical protein
MIAVRPRIREISEADVETTADLLTRGFVHRKREYWIRGLRRQGARPLPPDTPRYGYLLEVQGVGAVGCLLLIYSTRILDGVASLCCNVSSWYVDPAFRNYAALFASMTQKRKDVTYFNVTPAHTTWPILQAQGFVPYCNGLYFSVPVLSRSGGIRVEAVLPDTPSVTGLPDAKLEMLRRHAGYGSLCLVCHEAEEPLPFVFFQLRKRRGVLPVPAMQLGYCRSIPDYVRCAGAIGRYLLLRGKPIVIIDANGPVAGLPGIYSEAHGRKYFRGPHRPRLGDLTETELAIYGM